MGLSEATANVVLLLLTLVAIVMSFGGMGLSTGTGRSGRVGSSCPWAVGLILGGIAIGFGQAGLVPFLVRRDPRQRAGGVQVADRC